MLEALRVTQGGDYLDCTLGGAGHTQAILDANSKNTVTAIDRDSSAVIRAEESLSDYKQRVTLRHAAFSDLVELFGKESFDGILADLGISSDQLLQGRGFSFEDSSSLDMRMDSSKGMTAAEYINSIDEPELKKILFDGGVGNETKIVCKAIINNRPFNSAKELAKAINKSLQGKISAKRENPSTVVFQAIRIAVNQELKELQSLLEAVPALVKKGGKFAVITFHSLEDRAAARIMKSWEGGEFSASWPGEGPIKTLGKLIPRGAIKPSANEIETNPRARSARLRVFEFSK